MFVNGNLVGLGMFVAASLIVVVGMLLLNLPNPVVMISAGVALIIMDLVLRSRNQKNQGWLTRKQFGGQLFFVPVWIFGIFVIAANVINIFVGKSAR